VCNQETSRKEKLKRTIKSLKPIPQAQELFNALGLEG